MSFPNPFGDPDPPRIKCPVCGELEKLEARQNQYETFWICGKCSNQWSGGSVGAGQPDFTKTAHMGLIPPPGTPAPDDDLPVTQYTGAGFRDPGKNYGGDDW